MDSDSPLGNLVSVGIMSFFCWLSANNGYNRALKDVKQTSVDFELQDLRRKIAEMERLQKEGLL